MTARAARPSGEYRGRPAASALAIVVCLGLLGVAACSGGTKKKLIPPPPTTVGRVTTAPVGEDYTNIALDPVAGRTIVRPVSVLGGDVTLTGTVLGPDGPVGGATVRLERFVDDAIGRLDIVTNADGTWKAPQVGPPTTFPTVPTVPATDFLVPGQIPTTVPPTTFVQSTTVASVTTVPAVAAGVLGGRYRIRAWRTPDLALTVPQILFVEAKQTKQIPLQLLRYAGTNATAVTSPDPPVLAAPLTLTAIVSNASVDAEGVVRSVPAPNVPVVLTAGAGLELLTGAGSTNAQGRAAFQLRCLVVGPTTAQLTVNGLQSFNLPLRACVAPPSTTTLLFDPNASTTLPGSPSPFNPFAPPTT